MSLIWIRDSETVPILYRSRTVVDNMGPVAVLWDMPLSWPPNLEDLMTIVGLITRRQTQWWGRPTKRKRRRRKFPQTLLWALFPRFNSVLEPSLNGYIWSISSRILRISIELCFGCCVYILIPYYSISLIAVLLWAYMDRLRRSVSRPSTCTTVFLVSLRWPLHTGGPLFSFIHVSTPRDQFHDNLNITHASHLLRHLTA